MDSKVTGKRVVSLDGNADMGGWWEEWGGRRKAQEGRRWARARTREACARLARRGAVDPAGRVRCGVRGGGDRRLRRRGGNQLEAFRRVHGRRTGPGRGGR